jgi:hypothetical protein
MRTVGLTTLLLVLLLTAIPAVAVDVDLSGTFGNLGFAEDREASKTSLGASSYNWGFNGALSVPVSQALSVRAAVHRDPMTENSVRFSFEHESQYVTMAVGTYLGVLESFASPLKIPPGITASLETRLPGVGYATVSAGRPLTDEPTKKGEYWQQFTHAGLGFNLPNVIAGFHYRNAQKLVGTSSGQTRDERTEYAFTTDIFAKNVPYTVFLTFGYRDYTREFLVDGSAETTHASGSLLFGARVNVTVSQTVTVYTGISNGVYTFGREDLLGSFAEDAYLFQTTAGVSLSLDEDR